MTKAERARLELERRQENRKLRSQGKEKLTTSDFEMSALTAQKLREIAGIPSHGMR